MVDEILDHMDHHKHQSSEYNIFIVMNSYIFICTPQLTIFDLKIIILYLNLNLNSI
jgi:hypothetical protein